MKWLWRLPLAMVVLVFGGLITYAFGGGYFGRFSVPTPWNFLVVGIMGVGILALVGLILIGRDPDASEGENRLPTRQH
jgi:hypothetical protein